MTPAPILIRPDADSVDNNGFVWRHGSAAAADFSLWLNPVPELSRKRAGGGGGGGGGGRSSSSSSPSFSGGRSSSGTTSSSSSSSSSFGTSANSVKGFTPGTVSGGAGVYGSSAARGIANPYTISSGSFAGRTAGGGTRNGVYGSSSYGSGYTTVAAGAGAGALVGGAVGARGFPFIYWPVYYPYAPYYYGSHIYGPENNSSRPGGSMTLYVLQAPNGVNQSANNFALYGDANSVADVWDSVKPICGVGPALQANFTVSPNNTVQYYRASSFALLLQDYSSNLPNITTDAAGASSDNVTQPPAPLPSGVDATYLDCLNSTIGTFVPLLDTAVSNEAASLIGAAGFAPVIALLVAMLSYVS
ncbi:hypothetical protein K437DRAFT_252897 [Tilletiaria anomala UBC 951]|uniref:Uncharacterized protein n=1 Tax=Tilletiaria anomala (strain ATCC 24038 / CBS 436.72 / UBC 951) TaxID=1037660 RepID=A0A066WRA3_TILAU|nr:uncharacterized protein K437DRAFT_252897 [Tilletiaria anomala UBC 951]KDN53534.1 hypothetical protein K437DRAFT_252897 [Tilletiaria anomala UBC 951]